MNKTISVALTVILILTVVFTGCQAGGDVISDFSSILASQTAKPFSSTPLAVCVGEEPESMDPTFSTTSNSASVLSHLFEGLMRTDKHGNLIGGQALSYAISDDGCTYTFTLRSDIFWSDGRVVLPSDFVYAWRRAVNSETHSPNGSLFSMLDGYDAIRDGGDVSLLGVEARGTQTLVVSLAYAYPDFLKICALPALFPLRQDIVENNDKWTEKPVSFLSNGPYTMKTRTRGASVDCIKNAWYWNPKAVGPESLRFVMSNDYSLIYSAYQKGEILYAGEVPPEEIDRLENDTEFHSLPLASVNYLMFNATAKPLDNLAVRTALTLAIDRNTLCATRKKIHAQAASALVPPDVSDWSSGDLFREKGGAYYDADNGAVNLATALHLLKDEGYDGVQNVLQVSLVVRDNPEEYALADALRIQWKDRLGVSCSIAKVSDRTYENEIKSGAYGLWLSSAGVCYDSPEPYFNALRTTPAFELTVLANTSFDSLIDQMTTALDLSARYRLMHAAENTVFANYAICPLFFGCQNILQSQRLTGVVTSPFGVTLFTYTAIGQ